METRITMIDITIISSIMVKPARPRRPGRLPSPLRVRGPIRSLLCGLRIHVKHVLAAPTVRFRIVPRAAYAPVGGVREGIFGDAAEEPDLQVLRAGGLHAFHQGLELVGVPVGVELFFAQVAGVGVVLEAINGGAHLPQRPQQFTLPLAAHLGPRQRHGHGGEQQHDREGHDQLHQCESALALAACGNHFTFTSSCGVAVNKVSDFEFRGANCGIETVVAPRPTAWNVSVTATPLPLTPEAPGNRFRFTVASPESLRMFLVKMTCWPSLESSVPLTMSLRRRILGSNLTFSGAANRSFTLSSIRVTVMVPFTAASTCVGANRASGGPAGATGAAPCAGGAVAGGAGGAVAGGVGGAVAGGPAGAGTGAGGAAAAGGVGAVDGGPAETGAAGAADPAGAGVSGA